MHDGLVAHILDMLRDCGGISARRMFSGYGLFRPVSAFFTDVMGLAAA